MLKQVAEGVLVHESEFLKSNAVIVQGNAGVLLIDPGIHEAEMASIAKDLSDLGQSVVAGFSTHPHWDHLLWHSTFDSAPRYATARCAATIQGALSNPGFKDRLSQMVPRDVLEHLPLDLLGLVEGLPEGATEIPWDGPRIRVLEHQGHAFGHAALVIEDARVLVAGDMLSDILIPMLNLMSPDDQLGAYLAGLDQLEALVGDVDVVIPGHGNVGSVGEIQGRIDLDRAYVVALRDGAEVKDPRMEPTAFAGDFLPSLHERQVACCGPNAAS